VRLRFYDCHYKLTVVARVRYDARTFAYDTRLFLLFNFACMHTLIFLNVKLCSRKALNFYQVVCLYYTLRFCSFFLEL